MQDNGDIEIANEAENLLPRLSIIWDADSQTVKLDFKPEHFRTWQFVQHVLQMALENAKKIDDMATAQQVQAQLQGQAQAQRLANKLHRG